MGMGLRCLVLGVLFDGCDCGVVAGIAEGWIDVSLAVCCCLDWGEEIGLVRGRCGVSFAGGVCDIVAGIAAGWSGSGAVWVGALVWVVELGWLFGCGTGVSSFSLGI